MKLSELTGALTDCSSKAAQIARLIRSEKSLFDLLVQEKTGDSKNKRFIEDFKTLADVLVQETIKHDLGKQFAGIESHVFGEESNEFTNTLGETVLVQVMENQSDTAQLLGRVLDDNKEAADLLAAAVHSEVKETNNINIPSDPTLSAQDIGIWIDPIDSTAQYIHGYESVKAEGGVYKEGLQCVVVLIGAYHLSTGVPIVGVINQPFNTQIDNTWTGSYIWGLEYGETSLNSLSDAESLRTCSSNTIVLSGSENSQVEDKLRGSYRLCYAAGAGYKILCAVTGLVSAYVLSQGSTFKWDTCGPHAILKSLKGNIVDYKKAVESYNINRGRLCREEMKGVLKECSLIYNKPESEEMSQKWSNAGGLIAFKHYDVLIDILDKLTS